jgi:4-amino-4-deoxy-L-arabinose transferase-like glycosyltransferase
MKNKSKKREQVYQNVPKNNFQNNTSIKPSFKLPTSFSDFEKILETQRKKVILGIFCISLFLRLVYFIQAKPTALLDWTNWDQSDMHFFDTWAKAINHGDVWGHQPLHPVYIWNDATSEVYFKLYPDEIAKYQQTDTSRLARSKNLWYHWYNGKNFHQEPLYPYLIALTYKVFGESPHYVFFWQILLGALSNVLIFYIGCSYFGNVAGLLAAALAILCGPLMCYDLVLLRSTLTVFLGLLVVWQLGKSLEEKTLKSALLFGIFMGLGFLNQSYFILYFLFGFIYLGIKNGRSNTEGVRFSVVTIMGFGLAFIPIVIRNTVVGMSPFAMASNGGITFLAANFIGVDPYIPFVIDPEQYALTMYKTQGAFLPTFLEVLKQYNIGSFLMLMFDKFKTIVNWYEMPNNMNFYFFREWAPVLKFTFVSNYVLSPLALVGFVWALRLEKGKILPLAVFLVISIIPLMYGTALSRYRVLMLSFTTFFAAYTIVRFLYLKSEKSTKKLGLTMLGILFTFLFTANTRSAEVYPYDIMDYNLYYGFKYREALKEDVKSKNYAGVIEKLETFLSHTPPILAELNANRKVQNINEYDIAFFYRDMYERYADFLIKTGRTKLASEPLLHFNNLKNALEGVKK